MGMAALAGWQPIEDAPDHETVLVCHNGFCCADEVVVNLAWRDGEEWLTANDVPLIGDQYPVCWMSLPEPPIQQ